MDRINNTSTVPVLGEIESTNPCVTGDTYVSTEYGLMRMDDIYDKYQNGGLSIITDNRVPVTQYQVANGGYIIESIPYMDYNGVSLNEISNTYSNGEKDVYKLTTKSGYEIKTTIDHRFMTLEGWRELKQLEIGDEVLIQSEEGVFQQIMIFHLR